MAEIESFYVNMGQRIQRARSERKLTQEQLGERLIPPVTRASIANIEAGKQRVLAHTLWQLAAALKKSVLELVPEQAGAPDGRLERELAQSRIPRSTIKKVTAAIGRRTE